MDFEYVMTYDADPDRVYEMSLTDDFIVGRCEAVGAQDIEVEVRRRDDGGAAAKVRRKSPVRLPGVLRNWVGDGMVVQDTHTWGAATPDGSRDGTFHGHIIGTPVHMAGTLEFRPNGSTTVLTIRGTIGVHVPVIGSRLEPLVAQMLRSNFDVEQDYARQWLEAHPPTSR